LADVAGVVALVIVATLILMLVFGFMRFCVFVFIIIVIIVAMMITITPTAWWRITVAIAACIGHCPGVHGNSVVEECAITGSHIHGTHIEDEFVGNVILVHDHFWLLQEHCGWVL
jgi:hypothetical protein